MNLKDIFKLLSASGLSFAGIVSMITALMQVVEGGNNLTGAQKLETVLDGLGKLLEGTKFADEYAAAWGSDFVDAGFAGHINGETGYGPWPEGLTRFATLLKRVGAPATP